MRLGAGGAGGSGGREGAAETWLSKCPCTGRRITALNELRVFQKISREMLPVYARCRK